MKRLLTSSEGTVKSPVGYSAERSCKKPVAIIRFSRLHRTRFFSAIILIIGAMAVSAISFKEGWLTNLTEYATLVISGIVVIMIGGAGTLLYKSFQKAETQLEVKPTQPWNEPVAYSHSKKKGAFQKPQTSQLLPFYRSDKFDAQTDKDRYELEQEIFFTATFTGKLRAGYFESVLVAPDNKVHRVSDPQTFQKYRQRGLLRGEIPDAYSRWSTRVPIDCPLGEFTAHIGVYDSPPAGWFMETRLRGLLYWAIRRFLHKSLGILAPPPRPCVDQKTVRFSIVKRLEDGQA